MRSKRETKEIERYRDYPEGSSGKKIYDSVHMSFSDYLKKYYRNPNLEAWERWQEKYIRYAYDENRYVELIERFGYVNIEKHNLESQNRIYQELKSDKRLDEEIRKFIGFMAGTNFFSNHKITVSEWFKMKNWANPYRENGERTIDDILNHKFGINFIKVGLPHLDHWRR